MRYALLADIHANIPALEAVIADAADHNVGHFVCLGDIVGYGPQPAETLARIRALTSSVCLGNHDAAACGLLDPALFNDFARATAERAALALSDEDRAWLRDRPYILEGDGFACTHGTFFAPESFCYLDGKGDAELCLRCQSGFPLLLVAHTHIPCVYEAAPGGTVRKLPAEDFSLRPGCRYVVNIGTVGFPRSKDLGAAYAIYDSVTKRLLFRSVPYDIAPYRLAIVRCGYSLLNYWFLSPDTVPLRRELAFRNPRTRPDVIEGFAVPKPPRVHRSTLVLAVLGVLLAVLAFILVLRIAFDGQPARTLPPAHADRGGNLLPPLTDWYVESERVGAVDRDDTVPGCLTLTAPGRETVRIGPPGFSEVPKDYANLRFSVDVRARSEADVRYEVHTFFIRADGSYVGVEDKTYSRTMKCSYKIPIPATAAAFRAELRIFYTGSVTVHDPVLLPENRRR